MTWRDIAGLDEVINELQDTVILPFQKRHLLSGSKLFQPPKGTPITEPTTQLLHIKHTDLRIKVNRVIWLPITTKPQYECQKLGRHLGNSRYSVTYLVVLAGVLLFGPPGCGKTMIAKATAKASGCKFINLQASTLTDMWYGESQKLTAAVFSLAVKIQPCIIFIDEIGMFLSGLMTFGHLNFSVLHC